MLSLQPSTFAAQEVLNDLLHHLGRESPWTKISERRRDEFGDRKSRKPVSSGDGMNLGEKTGR